MNNKNLFDEISRILASGISRRSAFRLITDTVASGTAVSLLGAQQAHADSGELGFCDGGCKPSGNLPCEPGAGTCTNVGGGDTLCKCTGVNSLCGDNGLCCQPCPTDCCATGIDCCNGTCCPANTPRCSSGHCCPTGQFWNRTRCKTPNTARMVVAAVQPGPPMQLALTAQNKTYGIAKISVDEAVNCNITPAIPLAAGGTTSAIALTAIKIHHCQPARITLALTDPYGEIENKHILFTVLKLSTGKWVRQTFSDLLQEQAHLTLTNGSFGFTTMQVWVNSTLQHTLSLANNQTLTLDMYYEMTESVNTISLVGFGEPAASANVMLMDEAPDPDSKLGTESTEEFTPGVNIWGPLAEVMEDNSNLQLASISTQTIQLNLNDTLNGATNLAPLFTVELNEKFIVVESVKVNAGTNGTANLTLQLPPRTLNAHDIVDVGWQNLPNESGRALSGFAQLAAH